MSVYSYHASKQLSYKNESEKIKKINEGTLTFASKKKSRLATVHVLNGPFPYRRAVYEPPG